MAAVYNTTPDPQSQCTITRTAFSSYFQHTLWSSQWSHVPWPFSDRRRRRRFICQM